MPNFSILGIALVAAVVVCLFSGHRNERKWQPSGTEHELVDNQPSGWAWFLGAGVCIVGVLIAFAAK